MTNRLNLAHAAPTLAPLRWPAGELTIPLAAIGLMLRLEPAPPVPDSSAEEFSAQAGTVATWREMLERERDECRRQFCVAQGWPPVTCRSLDVAEPHRMDIFLGADERVVALVIHRDTPLALADLPADGVIEPLPSSWLSPGQAFAYAVRAAADPSAAQRQAEALLN